MTGDAAATNAEQEQASALGSIVREDAQPECEFCGQRMNEQPHNALYCPSCQLTLTLEAFDNELEDDNGTTEFIQGAQDGASEKP
jgi:tRNA(Ile2) C34 agmatinyltransferase TiaS